MSTLKNAARFLALGCVLAQGQATRAALADGTLLPSLVQSLDGAWLLGTDPGNVGREQKWFEAPRPEAKLAPVPWIIQDTFPGYHGVAWFWREFVVPSNPRPGGRCLLRFWAVDYQAQVWVNGVAVGDHEGGESSFVLDITAAAQFGATNRLAVRVLNPTPRAIDGIVLAETPHRNKTVPYAAGNAWDQGGIMDTVELLLTPAVRLEDLFVQPDWQTGLLRVQATVRHASSNPAPGLLQVTVAPAASGETVVLTNIVRVLPSGDTVVETELRVPGHRLWELNEPWLYRVTARVQTEGAAAFDERSVRCGFRDFRFRDGFFRLNGRRLA